MKDEELEQDAQLQKIIELNKELESKQREIDEQLEVLNSMSLVYDTINLLDFDTCVAVRFDVKDSEKNVFDLVHDPHTNVNKEMAKKIAKEDYDRFWDYTNLSTLEERMKGKRVITADFACVGEERVRAMYIRIGEDTDAPLSRVAYTLRNVTSEHKREYQVYHAITHLVYSLHIFDLENDTMERLLESDILKQIIGNETSAQKMGNIIIKATCKEEFLDSMLDFVDLSTVNERMEGKESLTCEFVEKFHGWTRMTFIPIERKNDRIKKMVITTEIIDSEKNQLVNLLYKSSTDELTRLYNRRTYEDDLDNIMSNNNMENLIIVAMDVNGLKTVNDTIGHKAGDELIIGASKCIGIAFNGVGRTYRTGGDEFMAILRCEKEDLPDLFAKFDKSIELWSGTLVENLSISYGYVAAVDYPGVSVRDLASRADQKMYEDKAKYYKKKGIERRRT